MTKSCCVLPFGKQSRFLSKTRRVAKSGPPTGHIREIIAITDKRKIFDNSMDSNGILLTLLRNTVTLSTVLLNASAWAAGGSLLDPETDTVSGSGLFPIYAACSTANSRPATYCTDWLTGPASSEHSGLKMYYGDRKKKPWAQGELVETDVGRPVMSPDGKQLELMVFGDTFAANPDFTLTQHRQAVLKCLNVPVNSFCANHSSGNQHKLDQCLDLFSKIQPKANACAYFFAPSRRLPVFDNQNNVTIFDAEIDASLHTNIKFKNHLYNKVMRHGVQEGVDIFGNSWFTGVYGVDYFYTCPGSTTKCENADRTLYFVTQTVFWKPTKGSPTFEQILYTKLGRDGIGFYRFGKLDATKNTTQGCRLRYGPGYANPPTVVDNSCTASVTQWLQPKHIHNTKIGPVERTDNVHVYWGGGGKFSFAIVANGYIDPYHAGSADSSEYIYFIGSSETNSQNHHTGRVYLARLPASEHALINAQFEYYKGKDASGASEWGGYQEAASILDTFAYPVIGPPVVTSFTARFGNYYLAATCFYDALTFFPSYGMCTASSKDGIEWKNPDFALYSDIVLNGSSPVKQGGVYGHMWVPQAIYPAENEIAYIFSVWKSPQGYFKDFYRKGGPESRIKAKHLFYQYNPKMFLYRPKGHL